jgi:hypothetical protein
MAEAKLREQSLKSQAALGGRAGPVSRETRPVMVDLEDRELVDELARRHLYLDRTAHDFAPLGDCPRKMG